MKLATLCYLRNEGKTLMIKKAIGLGVGKWNGLGGKIDPGESPEESVIREVFEESGLKISNPTLKGVLTFPSEEDGDDWYVFVYIASEFEGDLVHSEEGMLEWVNDNEILGLELWEGDKHFLPLLDKRGHFSGKIEYDGDRLLKHSIVFYEG